MASQCPGFLPYPEHAHQGEMMNIHEFRRVRRRSRETARREFLDCGNDALLPIVDAHHHYWDLSDSTHPLRYPWLQLQERIPFRYGDYSAICRTHLPVDHGMAFSGHRWVGSVLMEGEWNPADPVGEVHWVQALAAREGTPDAMAAQIWLDREDVADILGAYRQMPIVRSVRHKPRCALRHEHRKDWAPAGSMRDRRWRDGYALLRAGGLMFEMQAPWWHVDEMIELARDFPQTVMILNHAALPAERDEASLKAWYAAMARLAECENVRVKISGIGVPGQAWTAALQAPVVRSLLAAFGVSRCAFASNFPVDGLVADLDTIFRVYKTLVRDLSREDRLALFCDNAVGWYALH